jgi:hypothetical protein
MEFRKGYFEVIFQKICGGILAKLHCELNAITVNNYIKSKGRLQRWTNLKNGCNLQNKIFDDYIFENGLKVVWRISKTFQGKYLAFVGYFIDTTITSRL